MKEPFLISSTAFAYCKLLGKREMCRVVVFKASPAFFPAIKPLNRSDTNRRTMICTRVCLLLYIHSQLARGNSLESDIPLVLIPVFQKNPPETTMTVDQVRSNNFYTLISTDRWSVLDPRVIGSFVSQKVGLEKTTTQATKARCQYATNGGPFHIDGSSTGLVVVDKQVIQNGTGSIGFGITEGENPQWTIGKINDYPHSQILQLKHFITGFDWLVFQGQNVASVVNDTTGANRAARTAIGVDRMGKLIIVVADGCEKWYE